MEAEKLEALEIITKVFGINKDNACNFRIAFNKGKLFIFEKRQYNEREHRIFCYSPTVGEMLAKPPFIKYDRTDWLVGVTKYSPIADCYKDITFQECISGEKYFREYMLENNIIAGTPGIFLGGHEIVHGKDEYKGKGVGAYCLWFLDDVAIENDTKCILGKNTADAAGRKSYERNGYEFAENCRVVFKPVVDFKVRDIDNTQKIVTLPNGITLTVYKPIGGLSKKTDADKQVDLQDLGKKPS